MIKHKYRLLAIAFILFVVGGTYLGHTLLVNADAHSSVSLPDGNATLSNGYNPSKAIHVDSTIKQKWESNDLSGFTRGSKYPSDFYSMTKGNRLAYDVYEGTTSNSNKKVWNIKKHGGKDYLTFDGWAIIDGYYHHGKNNQATYIGVVNKENKNDRRIYKAQMTGLSASKDLEYDKDSNSGPVKNLCPNTGKNSIMMPRSFTTDPNGCNMEYKNVSFRAHLPLDELFQTGDEIWDFYIIKAVKAHSNIPSSGHFDGVKYVFNELILPYKNDDKDWGYDDIGNGLLSLSSGQVKTKMTVTSNEVIRRTKARSSEQGMGDLGYFKKNKVYDWVSQDEKEGTIVWHGIKSTHDNNQTRWVNSNYLEFGGKQAQLSWDRTDFDVTINHVDKSGNRNDIFKEEFLRGESGTTTYKPFKKGEYTDGVGYPLIPITKPQTINVDSDKTINFDYKVSVPDPSGIVERDGGTNTHGHATGKTHWNLTKHDDDTNLPSNYEDEYEWEDLNNNEVEITKYLGDRKNIVIPNKLDGKNVVSLGNNSFTDKGIKSVIIPDTVKQVKDNVFKDNKLENIGIPNSITNIGNNAFQNNELYSVIIPSSVTSIGNYAFDNNNLNRADLLEGLNKIGTGAFRSNILTEITIPATVEAINPNAFENNDIVMAYVNDNETFFGNNIFAGNHDNPKDLTIVGFIISTAKDYAEANNHKFKAFESPEEDFIWRDIVGGVEIIRYIGNHYIVGIPKQLDEKDVLSLGVNSISRKRITNASIPDTVRNIDDYAFRDNDLKNIIIPESVTNVGNRAFAQNKLTEATIPQSVTSMGYGAFMDNDIENVILPNNMTEISESTFENNKLKNISIPYSVTKIGKSAFSENEIAEFEVHENLNEIGEHAFSYNDIKELVFPDTLEEVGSNAFYSNKIDDVVTYNPNMKFGEEVFGLNKSDPYDLIMYGYIPSTAKDYADTFGHRFFDLYGTVIFNPDGENEWKNPQKTMVEVFAFNKTKPLEYAWSTSKDIPTSGWAKFNIEDIISNTKSSNEYYLHVRGTNLLNGTFHFVSELFKVDTTPPSLTLTNENPSGWQEVVTIKAASSDAHSGMKRIKLPNGTWVNGSTTTYDVTSNGSYTFIAEDKAGNTTKKTIKISNLDGIPPTLKLSQSPTSWTNGNVTITVLATDNESGMKRVRKSGGSWKNGSSMTDTVTSNGTYTFYAEDRAGNVTNKSIKVTNIDKTKPNNPTINGSTAWSKSNKSVTITHGSDSGSGVDRTQYRTNNGSWKTYSGAFTISANGSTKVDARTRDKAGNYSSITTKTFKIDKIKPSVSISPNSKSWTNKTVTITMKPSDSGGSGVRRFRHRYTTTSGSWSSWSAWQNNGNSKTATFSGSGKGRQIEVQVQDNAGNTTRKKSGKYNIDKTSPNVTFSPNSKSWTKSNVSITIKPSDSGGSGVKRYRRRYTNTNGSWGSWTAWRNTSSNQTVTFSGSGKRQLEVQVQDNAGNTTRKKSGYYHIDKVKPSRPTINGSTAWTRSNRSVSLSGGSDSHSGVDKRQYRLNGGSWRTYTGSFSLSSTGHTKVEARTRDKAGNYSSIRSKTFKIDKVRPLVSASPSSRTYGRSGLGITIRGWDNHSGISSFRYKWNHQAYWTYVGGGSAYIQAPTISTNERPRLTIVAVDNAGNSGSATYSYQYSRFAN